MRRGVGGMPRPPLVSFPHRPTVFSTTYGFSSQLFEHHRDLHRIVKYGQFDRDVSRGDIPRCDSDDLWRQQCDTRPQRRE